MLDPVGDPVEQLFGAVLRAAQNCDRMRLVSLSSASSRSLPENLGATPKRLPNHSAIVRTDNARRR